MPAQLPERSPDQGETPLDRLRRRDLMLTGVLENNMTPIYVKDLQGRYLLYNQALADLAQLEARGALEGMSGREVLIGRDDAWLNPGEASRLREHDARAERGPYRVDEVFDVPGEGGHTFESVKFPLYDAAGTVYATCGISLDTTDRTRAAQALADSEHHYRLLAENATDVVCEVDADNVMIWVSPSAESVLGWRPAQLVGTSPTEIVHPADLPVMTRRRVELSTAAAPPLELRVRAADGSHRWMSVYTRPTTGPDGSVTGAVIGLRDVHEQVLARQSLADSEHHYRLLAENATDVVYLVDPAGVFTWVSPAVRQVLGYDPTDLVGTTTVADLIHPDDQLALRSVVTRLVKGETGVRFELRVRTVTGRYRWMAGVTSRAVGAAGALDEGIGALRDVHEQVLARQALADSERLFHLALDGAPQGMAVVGLDLRFQTVNPALCTMLGRDEQWLLAHTVREVMHPDDLEGDLSGRDELLNGASTARIRECRWRRSDDSSLWVVHSIGLLRDEADLPLFYVSHVQDNTDAHRHQAELAHRASHDPLTGLVNRAQLHAHLTKVLSHARRRGGVPGLLFCDLDHFKRVNDTHGHAVGDDVLRTTAERMASVLRDNDILARLGGDEFVVVLNEVYDLAAAEAVAAKIRKAVSEPIPIGQAQITMTTSIGVALAAPGIAADRLLSSADAALYEAKRSGRDQTAVVDNARPSTS